MIGFQRLDWSEMPIQTVYEEKSPNNNRDASDFKMGWIGRGFKRRELNNYRKRKTKREYEKKNHSRVNSYSSNRRLCELYI